MQRARKRRIRNKYIMLILLLVVAFIAISLIRGVLARYTSTGTSNANVDLAYYIFEEQSISQTLRIDSILPKTGTYSYEFSVANNDGTKRTQTALEYTISMRTTTNLQLNYSVHKKNEATELITNTTTTADDDGTFFKHMTITGGDFGFRTNQQDTYVLEIEFPVRFNQARYQGILEYIEITVNSHQKIS